MHAGVAVLFVGVAASSSFQDEQEVQLSPGQSANVGAYEVTYVKPTAELQAAPNGRLEKIDFGAQLRVTRDGEPVTTMRTVKSYFPVGGAHARADLALLRGRGDERGRR